jgi:hypothetical protein
MCGDGQTWILHMYFIAFSASNTNVRYSECFSYEVWYRWLWRTVSRKVMARSFRIYYQLSACHSLQIHFFFFFFYKPPACLKFARHAGGNQDLTRCMMASLLIYKVVQIWPGLILCKEVTVCPGHIWTTLYILVSLEFSVSWTDT